jgi:hypothetical protein
MRWFRSRARSGRSGSRTLDRAAHSGDRADLEAFVQSRHGVEAYIEPATTVTSTTIVLVAHDGEWTRRRVPDERRAVEWARSLRIPVYDARIVGYPQRMRDWNSRQGRTEP